MLLGIRQIAGAESGVFFFVKPIRSGLRDGLCGCDKRGISTGARKRRKE